MGLGGVGDPEVNSAYHRAPLQIAPNISSAEVGPRRDELGIPKGWIQLSLPPRSAAAERGAPQQRAGDTLHMIYI